jgi:membrane protein required for beta-lactamase induction
LRARVGITLRDPPAIGNIVRHMSITGTERSGDLRPIKNHLMVNNIRFWFWFWFWFRTIR